MLIGSRDGSSPFSGDIADARFYNRQLTSAEVGVLARGRHVAENSRSSRRPAHSGAEAARSVILSRQPTRISPKPTRIWCNSKTEQSALEKMIPDTMVMQEMPKPRDTFVLIRGQYDKHGEKVEPGVPAVLPPLPRDAAAQPAGFGALDRRSGQSADARVAGEPIVGEISSASGIVKTSENLGVQTEWPSNPELLDWLATEMIRLHWDMKAFQKEIVMSAAYRQSSEVTPEMIERDPEDRLIARGPRFRLTAEEIRDQALAVSGVLVDKIGGPSVRPYEPADLWSGTNIGNLRKYVVDKGDGLYRRSIYTFIKRTATPANMSLFDQPTREYCIIRRSRTDTPLQALDLMNESDLCGGVARAGRASDERMPGTARRAHRRGIQTGDLPRTVAGGTGEILMRGFEKDLAEFRNDPATAAKLVAIGDSPEDKRLDVAELAAYSVTTSVILNLDETVTRQ